MLWKPAVGVQVALNAFKVTLRQSSPKLVAGMQAALERLAWLDSAEQKRR